MAKKATSKVEDSNKPGGGEGRGDRRQIDIDDDLRTWIDMIAKSQKMSPPDWLSNKIRPMIEAELAIALKRLNLKLPNTDD